MTHLPKQAGGFSSFPEVDERYIRIIRGRRFVTYAGLLAMSMERGLKRLEVEVLQCPLEENGHVAICHAVAETTDGVVASDIGEAGPLTLDERLKDYAVSIAATRSKSRSLRNLLGLGLTAVEELRSLETVIPDENEGRNLSAGPSSSPDMESSIAPEIGREIQQGRSCHPFPGASSQTESGGLRPATSAQLRAIHSISRRQRLTEEDLQKLCLDKFNRSLAELKIREASALIDTLKQRAA